MRRLALPAGVLLLAAIWLGPLLGPWRESFAAGMVAHMGVVAVAAPLLALGMSGTRWDISGRTALFAPVPAAVLELAIVWGWHAPGLRALAESSNAVTALEQASFLAAGLILWLSAFGRGGASNARRAALGAFALLLTSVHMTLLGALLSLAPRPLYGDEAVTCFGVSIDALRDQQIGGVLMLLVGAAVYLAGGVTLLSRVLADPAGTTAPGSR